MGCKSNFLIQTKVSLYVGYGTNYFGDIMVASRMPRANHDPIATYFLALIMCYQWPQNFNLSSVSC